METKFRKIGASLALFVLVGCGKSDFSAGIAAKPSPAPTSADAAPAPTPLAEPTPVVDLPPKKIDRDVKTSGVELVTEVFAASYRGTLDLQIVVDNSGSMAEEQTNMATKLGALLTAVADSDWRISINSTDPKDGCQRALIKKGDPNSTVAFALAVQAGTKGSSTEQSIFQAVEGLKGACVTEPWVRANSAVAVLFVTDEDNCSKGNCSTIFSTATKTDPSYLVNYLASIRVVGQNARAYGLFWHPSQAQATCPTGTTQATQLSQLVDLTKGTWGSICDLDYSTTLQKISKDMATVLQSRFILKKMPKDLSVAVWIDGVAVKTGYQIAGNVVTFTEAPTVKTEVKIVYEMK